MNDDLQITDGDVEWLEWWNDQHSTETDEARNTEGEIRNDDQG